MLFLFGTAVAAIVTLLVAFAVGCARKRHDGVDVAWGLGFAVVAVTGLVLSGRHGDTGMRWLITAMTVLWGLRLAGHIALRMRGTTEDKRYVELRKGRGNLHALHSIYLTQAATLWFVSLPVQAAQYWVHLTPWAVIGVLIWLTGLTFETVGDLQLTRFRSQNTGRVLDTGLWRYTRHPNYFGDALVWWGLWAVAATGRAGWFTVLSPILMTYLLARGTGKPLMEKHLSSSRPGYADYVSRTSGFIPWPPRHSVGDRP